MQKLRRWAAAALCGAAFAGSAAAVLAACAVCPGRAWIVRGALILQDPAAAAAIAWPADAARAAYKPQKPDRRPTPVPTATPVSTGLRLSQKRSKLREPPHSRRMRNRRL